MRRGSVASGEPTVQPHIMRALRRLLPPAASSIGRTRVATQDDVGRMLSVDRKTVSRWEVDGAGATQAWALVGLCARFDCRTLVPRALKLLVQAELPGSAVWGRSAS